MAISAFPPGFRELKVFISDFAFVICLISASAKTSGVTPDYN